MSVAISEAGGEYGAVVVSGANRTIGASAIGQRWAALWACKVLLLQNEIPEDVNLAAAGMARAMGARILLNAAPARELSPALLDLVDVLVVNRVEAQMLSGKREPEDAARALHSPARDVVVTLGGEGMLLMPCNGTMSRFAALNVSMISSHGAGDFFCGAMAARLAGGDDLAAALRFACAAAALLVSTPAEHQHEITAACVQRLLG
jgi:ribokinase